jgi:hypothetical protein
MPAAWLIVPSIDLLPWRGRGRRARAVPMEWGGMELLYAAHTCLELVLGLMKLRGRYQHEQPGQRSARSEMYVRHHASALLSLALLSALTQTKGLIDSEAGEIVNAVLGCFHTGAVLSFAHAWARSRSFPAVKVLVPHGPFAVAFVLAAVW